MSCQFKVKIIFLHWLLFKTYHTCVFSAASEMRHANCVRAMQRIGLSIISSSLTTAMGCLPLILAHLNPLRMFGVLIMISSFSTLLLTLLFGLPLLAIMAPVRASISIRRRCFLLFDPKTEAYRFVVHETIPRRYYQFLIVLLYCFL